jgi:rod shape determining protein RodA
MSLLGSPTEKKLDNLHWPLVLSTLLVCGLGLWNLVSATRGPMAALALQQGKAMALGLGAVFLFLFLDYRWLQTLAWPGYASVMMLLLGVAFAGKKVLGARRWLQLGPLQLQPSEFLKVAIIVVLARWFTQDEVGVQKGHYSLRDLFGPFLIVLVPVALVMKQPDLGTALVTLFVAMTMILFAKVRLWDLALLGAGVAATSVFAWFRLLKPYQKDRIYTFLNPQAYAKTQGYHAIQSQIAVGSGQFSGKGWAEGTQNQLRFLPEQHTDFIFSVWAEEHGFLLSALLVLLYGFIVLIALDIAANARDKFGSFLCIGVAGLFFWHAFINIGMVTGLLPVVGVPLPLFSYGGSSVIVDLLGIGVLLNVSLRRFMF